MPKHLVGFAAPLTGDVYCFNTAQGDGTLVTWSSEGTATNIAEKLFGMAVDDLMGADYEENLKRLEAVLRAESAGQ